MGMILGRSPKSGGWIKKPNRKGGQKMKKIIAMLLAAAMCIALAACGGTPQTSSTSGAGSSSSSSSASKSDTSSGKEDAKPVTLTYWMHSSEAVDILMDELVKEFNADNPDIIVKTEYIPFDDYMSKLIPALSTDAGPDVFKIQQGTVAQLAAAGSIQPLDAEVLPGSMIESEYIESTVNGMMYNGQYYGMPTDTQSIMLYWNKALVAAAGLDAEKGPQTWEEFFDWSRKLTKSENGVMTQSGWGTNGYWPEVQAYAEQYGKFYDEASGRFVFADDADTMAALEAMAEMYRTDKVYDINFSKNWAGFRIGMVAMMLGHPGMIGNLAQTAPDVDLGSGLIPARENNHTTAVTSWAFVASSKAPSDAATRFIQYLSSEEVMKRFCAQTGELPSRKALLEDASLKENPHFAVALESLNDSLLGRLQTGAMNTIWSEAWTKVQTTDEAFTSIMSACQEALNAELAASVK